MNEKAQTRLILGMTIAVIMAIGFAIALDFTPKGNVDMQWRYFITNGTKATFNDTVNITSTGRLYANQSWQHFNYPDACTSGYYITKLGDLVTCTTPSFFISNIDMNNYNITNVSRLGIGTANPRFNLEVNGTFAITGSPVYQINSTYFNINNTLVYIGGSDINTQLNDRSDAGALYYDGATTSTRNWHNMTETPNLNSSDFSLWIRFLVPSSNPTATTPIVSITPTMTGPFEVGGFYTGLSTNGNIVNVLRVGATPDSKTYTVANVVSQYSEKIIDYVVVRNSTANNLTIYLNGIPQTFTETVAGSGGNINSTIISNYLIVGGYVSGTPLNGRIYKSILFNRILSQSDVNKLGERDVSYADQWGNQTSVIDSSFYGDGATRLNGDFETLGTGSLFANWTNATAGTSTANQETSDMHAGSSALRFDIDSSNSLIRISQSGVLTIGKRYRLTLWAKINDTTNNPSFYYEIGGVTARASPTLTTTWTQYTFEVISDGSTLFLERGANCGGKSIYIDDVKIKEIGAIVYPDYESANPSVSNIIRDKSSNSFIGTLVGNVSQVKPIQQFNIQKALAIGSFWWANQTLFNYTGISIFNQITINDNQRLYLGSPNNWGIFSNSSGNLWLNREVGSGNVTIPSGSLGIGTTSPTEKLDVAGSINVTAGGNLTISSGRLTIYPNSTAIMTLVGTMYFNGAKDKMCYMNSTGEVCW